MLPKLDVVMQQVQRGAKTSRSYSKVKDPKERMATAANPRVRA